MPRVNFKNKIELDNSRDSLLSHFSKKTLEDRYLIEGESHQDLFARVSGYYADDEKHAQRLYDYISQLWFMPATPVLSNGGTERGLPISCFLNEVRDSLDGIMASWNEIVKLASKGGGVGTDFSALRSIGEKVKGNGKTSGIIPFLKVQDSLTLAISQGSLRRGSAAAYLHVSHPEIEEFIDIRKPTGGDPNRKTLNLHNAVIIPDSFMKAVENDDVWHLRSPKDGSIIETVSARNIWIRILSARIETGEPYLLFIDAVNRAIPEHHKKLGLFVKTSNLCNEITLPTGFDYRGKFRTAVCCLSSVNLEYYDQWKSNDLFIKDIMRFLDNVLQDFIDSAPQGMENAVYSAKSERSVGLGVMGLFALFQKRNIYAESKEAKDLNEEIFKYIGEATKIASEELAYERGACPDAEDAGYKKRNSNETAIAPTASISIISDTSPSVEPFPANSYTQKTLAGSFNVRNKHLGALLKKYDMDNEAVWRTVTLDNGSVKNLNFLSEYEKLVFKTAMEVDQYTLIDLASDRVNYISQSQSMNLFLPSNVNKETLHKLHMYAWKKNLKGLYYLRSFAAVRRADQVSDNTEMQEMRAINNVNNKSEVVNSEREEGDGLPNQSSCTACE